jgi:primosomal protein N' (replication factor Y)
LIEACGRRYGSNSWSILSRVIPAAVSKVDKGYSFPSELKIGHGKPQVHQGKFSREFRYFQPHQPIDEQVLHNLETVQSEQILIVAPDGRDIEILANAISRSKEIKYLSSGVTPAIRYKNYLDALSGVPGIYMGNRSSIFTPLGGDHVIFVLNDNDQAHYEPHFPGWNTRDVAIMRSSQSSTIFLSAFPSLEIARLMEIGWISCPQPRARHSLHLHSTVQGGSDILNIKSALKSGDVLVVANQSGYITAASCAKCYSLARCSCGGKLVKLSGNLSLSCALCEKMYMEWSCEYCKHHKIREFGKGSERQSFEIGRALPGITIKSNSDSSPLYRHQIHRGDKHCVVVSHVREIPVGSFSGVSIRNMESLLSQVGLRSEEINLRILNEALTNLNTGGELILDIQSSHPIFQALLRGEFSRILESLLAERKALNLTPYVRFAILWGSDVELDPIASAATQNPLFKHVSFESHGEDSRIIFRTAVESADKLGEYFSELSRLRMLRKEKPLRYRIDPFEISFAS